MRKLFKLIIIILLSLSFIPSTNALNALMVYFVPAANFAAGDSQKLVFDFALNTDGAESLMALTLTNQGTATNSAIKKLVLWKDDGNEEFSSSNDAVVGQATFSAANNYWYWDNLNIAYNDSVNLFVSADINSVIANDQTIQLELPALVDKNADGKFDLGDKGLYFQSTLNLPAIAMINWEIQTIKAGGNQNNTITAGDLIKGSGEAIYYYSANGKRYIFPTAKTYFSWYADFSTIKKVSDAQITAIQLDGNVTYKPGIKLLKIQSDPKVYAIAKNGERRWLKDETTAKAIFGANWSTLVEDLPVTFYRDYHDGADINKASDYSPTNEASQATTIDADRGY